MSAGSATVGMPGSGLAAAAAEAAAEAAWVTEGSPVAEFRPGPDFEQPARIARKRTSRNLRITELLLRSAYGLVKIPKDVVQVFDADREANEVLADAGVDLLGVAELLVRGGRGVDYEALGVAEVGEVGEDLDGVDQLRAGVAPSLDAEGDDGALAIGKVLVGELLIRAAGEAGVFHPGDGGVFLEPLGDRERVAAVLLHAELQRFDALDEKEGVEGADARAKVAQA